MSRFSPSSFNKEGKPRVTTAATPKAPEPQPGTNKPKNSRFLQELVETGRANWKIAPAEVKTRYRGIFLVLCSIPLLIFPSIEVIRRLEGKSVKKVRKGELLEGNQVRPYGEAEKWEVEKDSLMYKIFGRDFFLEGFTARELKKDQEAAEAAAAARASKN
ncbi:hypothetical protein DICA3_E27446 [Diutina catenulata]